MFQLNICLIKSTVTRVSPAEFIQSETSPAASCKQFPPTLPIDLLNKEKLMLIRKDTPSV